MILFLLAMIIRISKPPYIISENMSNRTSSKLSMSGTFYNRMSDTDIYVRGYTNLNELREAYNNFELKKIDKADDYIDAANLRIISAGLPELARIYVNMWHGDKRIEGGLPFTVDNNIIIRDEDISMRTIIHEKIHIYQRLYPEKFAKLYAKLGMIRAYTYEQLAAKLPLRNNPDNDGYIYVWRNKIILAAVYKNNAMSISDVNMLDIHTNTAVDTVYTTLSNGDDTNIDRYQGESPNEIVASILADLIYRNIAINPEIIALIS